MTMLDTCLNISGAFEGRGGANYALITGSFDGEGVSCGCLQWCAGQGSLQHLLKLTLGDSPVADDQFAPLFALKDMAPADAVAYAIENWIDPASSNKNLTAGAKALWEALLGTPQCIAAQNQLAQAILDAALAEAMEFLPWQADSQTNLRIAAFMFDVRVQQGGLRKKLKGGSHKPDPLTGPEQGNPQRAINFANSQGKTKTASAWLTALESGDPLVAPLLHYAFERASLGRVEYMWDTLARRGSLACRVGSVHGTWYDFTSTLP